MNFKTVSFGSTSSKKHHVCSSLQFWHSLSTIASKSKAGPSEKRKRVARKEEAARVKDVSVAAHQTWQENYGAKELAGLKEDVPADKLAEFLINDAVSGGDETFALEDLTLIDGGRILLCYQSPPGTEQKYPTGMRVVAYFEPLQTAVLNLTVIFDALQMAY
eukprot:COSAG02_NODE_4098_length_5781_cov_13.744984_7_plen_162_part_00